MDKLPDWLRREQITHVEVFSARPGVTSDWPSWAPPALVSAFTAAGIAAPWAHQVTAADLAYAGRDVVIATGTGSGKSLAYLLPALTSVLTNAKARILYLAPTKALAADQLRAISTLNLQGVRSELCTGDTSREDRDWIRQHANVILTNPDLLHHTILPSHTRWASLLRNLTHVIVDETHSYRGVFGAHVAHVLRRLRRLTGDRPVFMLASATSGDPSTSASRLIGRPVTAITDDASTRGSSTFVLYEPPFLDDAGLRVRQPPSATPSPALSSCLSSGRTSREPLTGGTRSVGVASHDALSGDPFSAGGASPDGLLGSAAMASAGSHDAFLDDVFSEGSASSGPRWQNVDGQPVRRSALRETGDMLADAVARGTRTLAFVPSRRGAEVVAAQAKRALDEVEHGLGRQVAAYRAGYLPEERRAVEQALTNGDLIGLATTSALELGIDVNGLDAVLLTGFPGTRSAMWQRAGRAGRAGRSGLCVLIARDDPLDTYLVHHPAALFHTPVEATVFDPANPYVLAPHLCTAAMEKPLTVRDLELFGAPRSLVDDLVASGALRERPTGWYWTHPHRPDIDLRGTGGPQVSVIEGGTGRLIGTCDSGAAHHHLHPGAVYTHQGRVYVVQNLDLDDGVAVVTADNPPFSTHARDNTTLDVLEVRARVDAGPVSVFLGDVEVTNQIVSFQRRRLDSGEVLGTWPLELPPRVLRTVAVWFTLTDEVLSHVEDVPGSLHAAEHAAIGLLPLVASCDRWDIGGLSTACHADTELPTIFVYDGHPGGAGFSERAFHMAADWLTATRDTVRSCACDHGCPSCVQSPKCGNGNNPLDKSGAVNVLSIILGNLAAVDIPRQTVPTSVAA
ncbi:DEAD/DEAH box helicase [Catelliglobosispora koreensis]|uniref:DEAD/DEAH box helicase n=1 Tax=Catelliglobosispora koreensis TaxID=129052 RepID=UPI00037F0404|nr:DEAD/DEAH box helicase [Catelliglobosispora koreensis]